MNNKTIKNISLLLRVKIKITKILLIQIDLDLYR